MSIPDGPFEYESRHPSQPIDSFERTLLAIVGTGSSGWDLGLPYSPTSAKKAACNYAVRLTGRTNPSAAGIHASEMLFTDDSGSYITQFRDVRPTSIIEPDERIGLEEFVKRAGRKIVHFSDERVMLPTDFPHVESHNHWVANKPGSILYVPIVDLTQQVLAGLSILLGERAVPFDSLHQRLAGDLEPFIRSGLLERDRHVPLADFEAYLVATAVAEIAIANHNITLALQALGLGGWQYSGINPLSLLGASGDPAIPGFGFRVSSPGKSQVLNPVGLDKYFEGFTPPYYKDMHAAVDAFVALKFGEGGTYDPATPGPFSDSPRIKERTHRYSAEMVECLKIVAQYIFDTYGKFPATAPSVYARLYTQVHHVDLDFYDRFFGPGSYLPTHRARFDSLTGND
jgi:hypothetical protein